MLFCSYHYISCYVVDTVFHAIVAVVVGLVAVVVFDDVGTTLAIVMHDVVVFAVVVAVVVLIKSGNFEPSILVI